MPAESIDLDAYFLSDVDVGNLRFFVVGSDPFVVAPYKIGDGLPGLYELPRFKGAAPHISVVRSGDYRIREIQFCHIQIRFFTKDIRFDACGFLARFGVLGFCRFLLLQQGLIACLGCFVGSFYLFILLLADGFFGKQVGIAAIILFLLPELGLGFCNVGFLNGYIYLRGLNAGT